MDYSVVFENLTTDISINPSVKLNQVRFIYSSRGGVVNPANKQTYPSICGLEVFCHLEKEPEEGRKILDELDLALYIAEETFTGLSAKTQCECYLARPITCLYKGKRFSLEDGFWSELLPPESYINGGEKFLDEASFIDEERNFHPMFHFYRVAKDGTLPLDYRALNAWRFLEALHGKSDSVLKEHLITVEKQPRKVIENFYESTRCAVAHAKLLKADPETRKVIVPRSYETEINGDLFWDLRGIIKYLDNVVAKLKPETTDIAR